MTDPAFPLDVPEHLQEPILRALQRVVDPEVAMDIVDVGLVYGVRLAGKELHVQVTMTSAACPVTEVIVGDIEHELDQAVPQDLVIRVQVVWEPPWTSDRMTPKAKRFMGW